MSRAANGVRIDEGLSPNVEEETRGRCEPQLLAVILGRIIVLVRNRMATCSA